MAVEVRPKPESLAPPETEEAIGEGVGIGAVARRLGVGASVVQRIEKEDREAAGDSGG